MSKRRVHEPQQYQILVVGDSAVGKTSLIARYVHNEYPCRTRSHINSDGSTIYPTTINNHECILIFINIPPTSNFSKLKISPRIPTICLIMFSISDQRSFDKIQYFQDSIDLLAATHSISIPIIVLANKADFEQERVVKKQAIENLKSNVNYVIETSVRTNQGIDEVLQAAIQLLQTNLVEPDKAKHSLRCIIL